MIATYRQRLLVYVVWHPAFDAGQTLARRLYDHLTRDSTKPIARGLGIPVQFRSAPFAAGSQAPRPIPLDEAQHTAVVVLVDNQMVLARQEGWAAYVTALQKEMAATPDRHRLLPVSLSDRAFTLDASVASSNFIRPPAGVTAGAWPAQLREQERPYSLLNPITHELCRLLLREPRLVHGGAEAPPVSTQVQVFVSHAKVDGAPIAEAIRDHVQKNSQLKTFFDVNDIPFGSEFAQVLERSVDREHTAMLVVQTDEYSTREWCQREVLWAKKYERPVLILHGVEHGEKCSFPYLGNTPTIRFDPAKGPDMDEALGQLLVEVLRNVHFRRHFDDLRRLFGLEGEVRALPQTPELLTLLELKADPGGRDLRTIVYQEPPLGEHLLDILRRFAPDLRITTPLLELTRARGAEGSRPLAGKVVGLSLSDSPDLARLGFDATHLQDAAIEFARYLLEAGAMLAYGGDLRPGGFTETLRDLVWTYDASDSDVPRLRGYLAWPIHKDTLKTDEAFLAWMDPANRNRTTFHLVPRPADQATAQSGPPQDRSPENLLVWARCLTEMRTLMNGDVGARVLLGGRVQTYMGRLPGLVEEALLAVRVNKPVYLAGGFGGCTAAVIDAVLGHTPDALTAEFQFRDDAYRQMVERHNALPGVDAVDYPALTRELAAYGVAGLSAHNGLTDDENRRLFVTPHVVEMIYLVLRGLGRVFRER